MAFDCSIVLCVHQIIKSLKVVLIIDIPVFRLLKRHVTACVRHHIAMDRVVTFLKGAIESPSSRPVWQTLTHGWVVNCSHDSLLFELHDLVQFII